MAESPVRLPDWKRDIWRESPRKIESFQKPRIPIYEKIYEKKLPKPLPVARADSAFRFTDTGMTDRYELLPDISTTMRGSQLPKVKKVLTELLADPSYVAAEARAVAESYQISANLFYMGASKPKTLRVAVEQRFDDAARKIALGMSQMAHLLGLGQLLNLGNTFTQRDAAVIMRAGIDRVDLCSDQLYQTLTGSKFRDMYVAAVLPKAERLLRHSI
ncbi:hypothetical protein HYX04_03550 [Candidatus Woesearchaeota archaeon]|nr:hypothetical protein [Candidatus Woesearchaeota archaeon]